MYSLAFITHSWRKARERKVNLNSLRIKNNYRCRALKMDCFLPGKCHKFSNHKNFYKCITEKFASIYNTGMVTVTYLKSNLGNLRAMHWKCEMQGQVYVIKDRQPDMLYLGMDFQYATVCRLTVVARALHLIWNMKLFSLSEREKSYFPTQPKYN